MASKRRNMFYQNKKQETTKIDPPRLVYLILRVLRFNFSSFAFKYAKRKKRSKISVLHNAETMPMSEGLLITSFKAVAEHSTPRFPDVQLELLHVSGGFKKFLVNPKSLDVVVSNSLNAGTFNHMLMGVVGKSSQLMRAGCESVRVDILVLDAKRGGILSPQRGPKMIDGQNEHGTDLEKQETTAYRHYGANFLRGHGVMCGQNIGEKYRLYEPAARGKGASLVGQNKANPQAMLMCGVAALEELGHQMHADVIRYAIRKTLSEDRVFTFDLGGKATTKEFTNNVIQRVRDMVGKVLCSYDPPPKPYIQTVREKEASEKATTRGDLPTKEPK
ncbi:hypothetical protein AAG570_002183 [Ranatra chinensis]|uniref:Isopropylmalate dehydrogenase-like domain-containing protein n=1 Tax=Ranatra chinensis TaxID=642074 RepID=A0ABD0Y6R7_9HEMI